MEELKRLFEFVDSKDKEISELYLKLILDKYGLKVIHDYTFYVHFLKQDREQYIKEVSTKTW